MTPDNNEELAEEIMTRIGSHDELHDYESCSCLGFTLKKLKDVEREMWNKAKEEDAKIAENVGNECLNCLDSVAKEIRALKLPGGEA